MICCQIIVKKIADKYEIKVGDVKKLIPNLGWLDYAAIHEIKPVLMLNKPIYVGFTVLELIRQMVDVWLPLQLY